MKQGVIFHFFNNFFAGKSLIIIIAVTISASSFCIGYLVGKRSDGFHEKRLIAVKQRIKPSPPPVSPEEFDRSINNIIKKDLHNKKVGSGDKKPDIRKSAREQYAEGRSRGDYYTVQVGAFKRETDAHNLKSLLEKKGYNSYIKAHGLKKGKMYKVRVGNFSSRDKAAHTASHIKKTQGLDAFILISREGTGR